MEKLWMATENANKLVNEKLYQLPYFNDINFRKNAQNLRWCIAKDAFEGSEWISYLTFCNTIIIDESRVQRLNVPVEVLQLLVVHEYIRMASTNVKKRITGFESKDLPITYNEGLTQWLTLKICYGDNMDKAIKTNFIYPESVKKVNELINDIGEDVIFNHFFEADFKMNVNEIPCEKKDQWINTILELSTSYEENLSKSGMALFCDKINRVKQKSIK